jgi:hypothetical protein
MALANVLLARPRTDWQKWHDSANVIIGALALAWSTETLPRIK